MVIACSAVELGAAAGLPAFLSLSHVFWSLLSADVAADGARSYRKHGDKEASKGDEG
jgi:hypothetical protein